MQAKFFSIIVVSLNPGEGLWRTLDSIGGQTFADAEILVKDGGSRDGSRETLEKAAASGRYPGLRVVEKADRGIYDAMNQAVGQARGEFFLFLNCGDTLHDPRVLERVAEEIRKAGLGAGTGEAEAIFYGNQYHALQRTVVHSPPEINDFTCYRNLPCHQVCFYSRALFDNRGYDTRYRVRADYEHFLYCFYQRKAAVHFMPFIVADYEGGGFSEAAVNKKASAREHREIALRYLGEKKVGKYRLLMWLSLAPLRTKIAENPALSGFYHRLKRLVYGNRRFRQ